MNRLLQLGWTLRRRLIGALRLRTRGVKVLLVDAAGDVLLIRNAYGDTKSWVLPGGRVAWREAPIEAASREAREEVGLERVELRLLGTSASSTEGKRDHISLCHGTSDQPVQTDGREVLEAGFFPIAAVPHGTSPATRRRLSEWQNGGPFGSSW